MRPSDKVRSSETGKIRLKESYKQAKLSIEELATKAKVSTDTIQRLLGTRKCLNGVERWSVMLPAITENSQPDANLGESSLFSELPSGLEAYYQNHWLRMKGDGLSAVELSVLNVLVESTAGLSVTVISEIIDEDEYDVEKVLDNWIQFLLEFRLNSY